MSLSPTNLPQPLAKLFNSFTFCQYNWYNHSELNWHTLETEHFLIHFHDETERSAREAAEIVDSLIVAYSEEEIKHANMRSSKQIKFLNHLPNSIKLCLFLEF